MSQKSHSPAALDRRLEKVEQKIIWVFAAAAAVFVSVILPSFASWINRQVTVPIQITAPAQVQAPGSATPTSSPGTTLGH